MNDKQLRIFNELSNKEARDFFILYVGLDCFVKHEDIMKLTKQSLFKELNESKKQFSLLEETFSFRLKIINGNNTRYLLYRNSDRRFCFCSVLNEQNEFLPINNYKDELPKAVVDLLLDVAKNNVKTEIASEKLQSLLLLKPDDYFYRFVVGAGINHGYGLREWKSLEDDFKNAINSMLGPDSSESINRLTFNANYGSFQILKDIDETKYKNLLLNTISPTKLPSLSDNTTLTAIAAVLYAQTRIADFQLLLTFNYDEMIELSLNKCFGETAQTIYKHNKAIWNDTKIAILHSHGYLSSRPFSTSKHFDSIVLTTDEYFKNYENPSSYGYDSLYNQLNKTSCFVGNSITDYEEQKVISTHFNKHPAQFHFCYCSSDKLPIVAQVYKTIFLLKIGIIPLWYSSHNLYKDEFYQYAERVSGKRLR